MLQAQGEAQFSESRETFLDLEAEFQSALNFFDHYFDFGSEMESQTRLSTLVFSEILMVFLVGKGEIVYR